MQVWGEFIARGTDLIYVRARQHLILGRRVAVVGQVIEQDIRLPRESFYEDGMRGLIDIEDAACVRRHGSGLQQGAV